MVTGTIRPQKKLITMNLLGLIGYPLEHSFSKRYFAEKFQREQVGDWHYENFPMPEIRELPKLLQDHQNLVGLNVTIPHKESVIDYVDHLDPVARTIGAVNTLLIERDDDQITLSGYNTDYIGFMQPLVRELDHNITKALVLGSGGASRAVRYVLDHLNIEYKVVSRSTTGPRTISYDSVTPEIIKDTLLIINTTPRGMYPDTDEYPPIPYDLISGEHLLYDLVYHPEITQFLAKGINQGARILKGTEMLHIQAEKSWQLWKDHFRSREQY